MESEIGQNKAVTLISRYNYHFGLNWLAMPERFHADRFYYRGNVIVISAVDSRKSRKEIHESLGQYSKAYCIDCGCGKNYGQIYIGNGSPELPYPWIKHPELTDVSKDIGQRSSCSMADSLERHGLFINQFISVGVLEMIWQLFRHGGLDYSELYINLKTGRMMPKLINPENHPNK